MAEPLLFKRDADAQEELFSILRYMMTLHKL